MTVGDILTAEPLSAGILRKYKLDNFDYGVPFETACRRSAVDPLTVKEELIHLRLSQKANQEPFSLIVEGALQHHRVVRQAILLVRQALGHALRQQCAHGLREINERFENLVENLEVHLYKEEVILFPEFINLWNKKQHYDRYRVPFPMRHPIQGLEDEHESTKVRLAEIRQLTKDQVQKHGHPCRTVDRELGVFEKEILTLMERENQALFPEALALEKIFTCH